MAKEKSTKYEALFARLKTLPSEAQQRLRKEAGIALGALRDREYKNHLPALAASLDASLKDRGYRTGSSPDSLERQIRRWIKEGLPFDALQKIVDCLDVDVKDFLPSLLDNPRRFLSSSNEDVAEAGSDSPAADMQRLEITLPHIFVILKAMIREDGFRLSLRGNEIYAGSIRLADSMTPLSETDLTHRIPLLAKRVGLSNINPDALCISWRHELIKNRVLDKQRLIETALQSAAYGGDTASPLRLWRGAMEQRLFEAIPQLVSVERFDSPPSSVMDCNTLELAPLLEAWPLRLMTDRRWAYAEPPLPEIEPMPLDAIWVDVTVVDPLEEAGSDLTGDVAQAMDNRYEDRQLCSEPASFVLERLRGSAALIGNPGIGKTTLLKWMAGQLIRQSDGRFLLPLYVPLRAYSLEKSENTDMLSFALQQCGIVRSPQIAKWKNTLEYLSGVQKKTVLLLLDGWDEVPADRRESLRTEMESLSYRFAFIITSRHSAYPESLPVDRLHEITDLPPQGIHTLIHNWFRAAGHPDMTDRLLGHLDAHPDLRRMARNPFLLNLICGICFSDAGHSGHDDMPTSRTGLYRRAIQRIRENHSSRYPEPFHEDRQRQAERLAYWLIAEAPDAPRYVFNSHDVLGCSPDLVFFKEVLCPSRLVCQWDAHSESMHFLHTTFQEYLAARHLIRDTRSDPRRLITAHALDAGWQEIFRFIAGGNGEIHDFFWRQMRELAEKPDRFGLIFIRMAHLVAETGAHDGGKKLVGIDLRDNLWPIIREGVAITAFVDAYLCLDTPGYIERVRQIEKGGDIRLNALLKRSLRRAKNPESSRTLVEDILSGDKKTAEVASYPIAEVIDDQGRGLLRDALNKNDLSIDVRRKVIRALGYARDYDSARVLLETANHQETLAEDAFYALANIGGSFVSSALVQLLSQPSASRQKKHIIHALRDIHDGKARDGLLAELALCEPDAPVILPILEALSENPLPLHNQVLIEFMGHPDEQIRAAAAWALIEAGETCAREALVRTAQQDNCLDVRAAALAALRNQAGANDIPWLADVVKDSHRDDLERANALEAILMTTARHLHRSDRSWMIQTAAELARIGLGKLEGELTYTAASRGFLLGEALAPRLCEICMDETFPSSVREEACVSLGKIRYSGASGIFLKLIRGKPDVEDDEASPLEDYMERLARAAAEAITKIDARLLLTESGKTAQNALKHYSLRTGHLVFSDHILDSQGKRI
ncbi:MAG: HEAT repeat domain-containing protein [Pseudomonadota bacterium]